MGKSTLFRVSVAIVLAVVAGVMTGPDLQWGGVPVLEIYGFVGQLFLNALSLIVIPLIASSIITGASRIGQEGEMGTLGKRTFCAFLGTTLLAVLCALFVTSFLQPGVGHGAAQQIDSVSSSRAFTRLTGIVLQCVPSNIISAAGKGEMLGVIFFSLLFGALLPRIEKACGTAVTQFFQGIFQVMMEMTKVVLLLFPIGVFALVAKAVADSGLDSLLSQGYYFLTVLIAMALYAGVVLPLLLWRVARVNPVRHFRAVAPALLTAFSTSTSSAALPVTLDCMEKKLGVPRRICGFTLPLGASLNMSGTALFQCVSVLFIAQMQGVELDLVTQGIVVFLSFFTSVGMAGIPAASLLAIVLILQTVGLSAEGIGSILVAERVLDMCRSAVNVYGNSCCTALVAQGQKERAGDLVVHES